MLCSLVFGWRIYVFVIFVIVVVVSNDFQLCITHTQHTLCAPCCLNFIWQTLYFPFYFYIHILLLYYPDACFLNWNFRFDFSLFTEFNMLWGWENIYIFKWTHNTLYANIFHTIHNTIQWHKIKYEKSKYAKKKKLLCM